ncbi:hypothetical protein RBH20_17955 [Haloarcula sp. H-GB4]|uniref:hypothetical protein n=1 Tax=Haloarcula sp. H-GB4 TaxID=3069755 RepID=UPI0027B76E24|nr:hypothetical protein [Haloarcula sp. H-GB4]MDQ2074427.1 hypothetical protein [Haloarcula sp. H-GB4]
MKLLKFGQVSVNLTHISLNEANCLADTVRVVLNDRPQEFERLWSSDSMDISWVVIHDFEMWVRRSASIECSEGIFKTIVTTLLESDTVRAAGRA